MEPTDKPIIVEQRFSVSKQTLWQAITETAQMREWFFSNIPAFDPVKGFTTEFMVETPEKEFLHIWKILEVIPERKIIYNWRYGGYTGNSTVTFELSEGQPGAMLKLTHAGMESFPPEIPEFSRANCKAGWEYFIGESLRKYLEENPQ